MFANPVSQRSNTKAGTHPKHKLGGIGAALKVVPANHDIPQQHRIQVGAVTAKSSISQHGPNATSTTFHNNEIRQIAPVSPYPLI